MLNKVSSMDATTRRIIFNAARGMVASHDAVLKKFAAKLKVDPCSALTWGDSAFQSAAARGVWLSLMAGLKSKSATLPDLRKIALKQMMHDALYPPHSTSPCANYLEECEAAAWARVYEFLMGVGK